MEKRIKILTGLITMSLLLNVYSISRLGGIHNSVSSNLSANLNHTMYSLSNDISGLYRIMDELKEENRWIVSGDFKPNLEASTPVELYLDFEWFFREVEKEAKVLLFYRDKAEPEMWKEVMADNIGMNNYRASLVLYPEKDYEYQLVSKGSLMKASEIKEISSHYYKPAPLEYSGAGASSANGKLLDFNISFSQREPVLFDFYRIKNVKAIIHYGNEQKTITLKSSGTGGFEWSLAMESDELDRLMTAFILEMEYENGAVEEKNFTATVLEVMTEMAR